MRLPIERLNDLIDGRALGPAEYRDEHRVDLELASQEPQGRFVFRWCACWFPRVDEPMNASLCEEANTIMRNQIAIFGLG